MTQHLDTQHLDTKIIVTDQAGSEVVVVSADLAQCLLQAAEWRWSAALDPAIPSSCWGLPNDVRVRSDASGQQVLISDSYGLLAQVGYPAGEAARWFLDLGREADPHGIELLPGGWLATAASKGHFVRIYAPGPERSSRLIAEASLPAAHQVLWDDTHALLWVLGGEHLVGYALPSSDAPGQTLEPVRRHTLPTSDGHDLQPMPGDPEHLWVTTVAHVYVFDIASGSFDRDFAGAGVLDRHDVKSVGTTPEGGVVLQTQMVPDEGTYEWTTDHVDVLPLGADGAQSSIPLRLPGAEIYRARWFDERSN